MRKLLFSLSLLFSVSLAKGATQAYMPVTDLTLNTRIYGAKCDGVTDDAPAIKRAEAVLQTNGGGGLYFPSTGTCVIGSSLTIHSNVKWFADTLGAITLKAKANLNDRLVGNFSTTTVNIAFENLVFDMNGSTQSASTAVTIRGVYGHYVRNCKFKNPYDSLYLLTGTPQTFFNANAYFENNEFDGSNQVVAADVVDIGNGTNIHVDSCYFHNAKRFTGAAVFSAAILDDFTLTNSYIDGNGNGDPLSISGVSGGKVDGNVIINSYEAGFRIQPWTEFPPNRITENFSICNNTISSASLAALWVRASTGLSTDTIRNLKIYGNNISSSKQSGIQTQVADGIMIFGNSISSNSLSGAGLYAALDFQGGTGGGSITNAHVFSNNIKDAQASPTQTLLYNLNFVDGFYSHENIFSQITSTLTVATSSNVYVRDMQNPMIIPTSMGGTGSTAFGQYISSGVPTLTGYPTSTQYGDLAAISLTAGTWDITGVVISAINGATVVETRAGISSTSGNSATGLVDGDNLVYAPPPQTNALNFMVIPNVRVVIATTTIYYLKYRASFTVAVPTAAGRLSATRIK